MNPISAFLARFKDIRPPSEKIGKELVASIQHVLGVTIEANNVDIRHGTAFIAGSSTLKNEVVLHEQEILAELAKRGCSLVRIR